MMSVLVQNGVSNRESFRAIWMPLLAIALERIDFSNDQRPRVPRVVPARYFRTRSKLCAFFFSQ